MVESIKVAMKKYSVYMMLLAMVMLNIASIAHASCALVDSSHDAQVIDLEGTSDVQDHDQDDDCHCCHGSCPHYTFVTTTNKVTYLTEWHNSYPTRDGTDYPSHLQHPPSKPPKA